MLTNRYLKGRLRHDLSEFELLALEDAVEATIELAPREPLLKRGDWLNNSYYLIEGTTLRFLDDKRGERQLLGIQIAGDFVDLHSYAMKRLDHDIAALDHCLLAKIPHEAISHLIGQSAHLARAMWFSTLLDAAIHREWIFRLGRLNAEARIAHLLSELIRRLSFVELYDGRNFAIPMLQRDYAEACGITAVHANRSFRTLKERGAIDLQGEGRLLILDEPLLNEVGQFDGDYLYGPGQLAIDTLKNDGISMDEVHQTVPVGKLSSSTGPIRHGPAPETK